MTDERPDPNHLLFYRTPDGATHIELVYQSDSFWMPQRDIAELFGVGVPAVSKHLKNIFETAELEAEAVLSILETTASDGKVYSTKHYNLDAIIAVGYRVNSYQATQFRIWATQTLKEYVVKGFVLDDERLKQGQRFGRDYFDELLERIREIRASERRFYQKVTDIYALSADYDRTAPITREFFSSVQNKLHWAITGKTAAEIVHASADASLPNMGLTTWKQGPDGKVLKSDVTVAKNYLTAEQVSELNRNVSAYQPRTPRSGSRALRKGAIERWSDESSNGVERLAFSGTAFLFGHDLAERRQCSAPNAYCTPGEAYPAAIFTSLNHPAGISRSTSHTIRIGRSPEADTHRTPQRPYPNLKVYYKPILLQGKNFYLTLEAAWRSGELGILRSRQ